MGKKVARLMARIVALEEAMALMLRGSLSHGIKKKKAKARKAKKTARKKAAPKKAATKRAAPKKPAPRKAAVKKAPVAKPVRDVAAISAGKPAPIKAARPAMVSRRLFPRPQAAMPPGPRQCRRGADPDFQ